MCVVSYSSLYLLTFSLVSPASGISCLPLASFAAFVFLLGFFCSFPASSSVLSPTSSGGVPWLIFGTPFRSLSFVVVFLLFLYQPSFCSVSSCVVPPVFFGSSINSFVSFSWALRLPFLFSSRSSGRSLCLSTA